MRRLSLYTLLSDWWANEEITLSHTSTQGSNLLTLAAAAGCIPICEALIKRGIQVNLQSGYHGTALAAAACEGQTQTVKFLIQQGADINIPLQMGMHGSSLAAAVWERAEIVDFLVQKGGDVNMLLPSSICGNILAAAAYWGGTQIVKLPVEQGADTNMHLPCGDYSSAVVAAATAGGEPEIMEFLLREGSTNMDTMLQSVKHRSALAVAAYWGWIGRAESLIDAGADVNLKLKSGHYDTALQASQVDVSQENRERAWWDERDERDEKTLKQDKARVTELLQRHGAINEA